MSVERTDTWKQRRKQGEALDRNLSEALALKVEAQGCIEKKKVLLSDLVQRHQILDLDIDLLVADSTTLSNLEAAEWQVTCEEQIKSGAIYAASKAADLGAKALRDLNRTSLIEQMMPSFVSVGNAAPPGQSRALRRPAQAAVSHVSVAPALMGPAPAALKPVAPTIVMSHKRKATLNL